MKSKRVLFLTFLFLITGSIFSQPFDMILTGDPVLDDLRFLSIESGNSFLSFSPPLSPHELHIFLDSIDTSSLSQPAAEAYYRVLKRLAPVIPLSLSIWNFSGSLNINVSLEGRVRINEDISWEPKYNQITPLLSIPIRLHFSEYIQFYIEPHVSVTPDNISYINFPLDSNTTNYWPVRSFAAAGGSFWNFQIGRDNINWGTSHSGSLTFGDKSTFYDFARLSFFMRYLKYSIITTQLPLKLDSDLFLSPDDAFYPVDWKTKLTRTMQRYYYLHRLDVNLFDKVSIGIMEGVMAGNSPIEIRYLNPLLIFHSLFSWRDYDKWGDGGDMNGSHFSLEVNWNIVKSLAFYGQFVMNQFALKTELDGNSDQPPDALGYLAGLHYTHSFDTWASIFYLEFIYTDPYLYMLASPFASFINEDWDYKYIAYPRDTMALTVGTKFVKNDKLNFSGSISWISSGEHNKYGLKWDWRSTPDARNEKSPSGTAENKLIFCFGTFWKPFPFFQYLALKADISLIASLNNGNISDNNQFGAQGSLSVSFHY